MLCRKLFGSLVSPPPLLGEVEAQDAWVCKPLRYNMIKCKSQTTTSLRSSPSRLWANSSTACTNAKCKWYPKIRLRFKARDIKIWNRYQDGRRSFFVSSIATRATRFNMPLSSPSLNRSNRSKPSMTGKLSVS